MQTHRALLVLLSCAVFGCGDNTHAPVELPITYDREVHIPGLDGTVSVFYDGLGMLSLECETDLDCFAAQGYFHANDRFFQMDLRRRFALGRLSELVGPFGLDIDHQQRTKLSTREGKHLAVQLQENLSPEMVSALDAYARGVNAWLEDVRNDRNGAKLSSEYDFMLIDKTRLEDWTPKDSIACFLPIVDTLTNDSPKDLLSGEAIAALGLAMGSDLFGVQVVSKSSVLPQSTARKVNVPAPRDLSHWLSVIRDGRALVGDAAEQAGQGSNNWIVGKEKGGGKAFMSNDPHLVLSNPSVWYMIHLDSKTKGKGMLHLAGASFPGLPGILLGHNESIAWGATTTRFDQADVYLETLNDAGDAVVFNGSEVAITSISQTYEVSGKDDEVRTIEYVPHHGPILSKDVEAKTATSLRWVAQDATTDFNFLWKIWIAGNREEGRVALEEVGTIGQNFVVADLAGEIGWYPYNLLPERTWMAAIPSWFPLPGDGSAEWGPYLPYSSLPQSTNPAAGFLATANNDMTGHLYDGDPSNDGQAAIQNHAWAGFRHERIVQLLAEKVTLSIDDMHRIQHDTKSLLGQYVVPTILADLQDASLSGSAQDLASALIAWDFFCPSGFENADIANPEPSEDPAVKASSRGCLAFHVLWARLKTATFADEMDAASSNLTLRDDPLAIAFLRPETLSQDYWDNVATDAITETRADIVLVAIGAAGEFVESNLGTDTNKWRWGELHTLSMPADLFEAAGVTEFSHGPMFNNGGLGTVNWAPPTDDVGNHYGNRLGPAFRLSCELDTTIACHYQLPGGQRHIRTDSLYLAMLMDWLEERPQRLPFTREEVLGSAAETIAVKSMTP